MGTAGPLAVAREILDDGSGEPFFVLNSDVICEFPLQDLLDKHKESGAEATIFVTKVCASYSLSALSLSTCPMPPIGGGSIQVWCGGDGR